MSSSAVDIPIPGHVLPLCASCRHRTSDLSHPSPCDRVRWIGPVHVKPALVVDGDGVVRCRDYEPAGQPGRTPTEELQGPTLDSPTPDGRPNPHKTEVPLFLCPSPIAKG